MAPEIFSKVGNALKGGYSYSSTFCGSKEKVEYLGRPGIKQTDLNTLMCIVIVRTVTKISLFVVRSVVGYMPMMLLRLISRKISEQSAVKSAQQQREYAQALASRMRGGAPGGGRPQPVGTHYQPPYYYHEVAYGKDVSPELDITYE